jgi:Mg-chelatase subunit ChlD
MSVIIEMNSENVFTQKSFEFEETPLNTHLIPFLEKPETDVKFGLLNITTESVSSFHEEYDFIYVLDQSGSMDDKCADGRTKMHHCQHTLKNMIHYIHSHPELKVHVTILSFDDTVYTIMERTAITKKNLEEILSKIDNIRHAGGTNIEIALSKVKETIQFIHSVNSISNIIQIFMTDGDVNLGSNNHEELIKLVDENIYNHFIGFGLDHNSILLNAIASGTNSHYRFIDKIENAGIVYGEIFNEIFNRSIQLVKLEVTNGYIYDFKTNTWNISLEVGDLVGEICKSFHIVSKTPEDCSIMFSGLKRIPFCPCPYLHDGVFYEYKVISVITKFTPTNYKAVLTPYVYRQQVLQLLFQSNKYSLQKNNKLEKYDIHKSTGNKLKEDLSNLLKEMKTFMLDNNLLDDKFMKNLCDDVYICYKTMRTPYGAMYANARLSSQGSQRAYSARYVPEKQFYTYQSPCFMRRANSLSQPYEEFSEEEEEKEEEDEEEDDLFPVVHQLSNFGDAPYVTPKATFIMRSFSEGTSTSDIYNIVSENKSNK